MSRSLAKGNGRQLKGSNLGRVKAKSIVWSYIGHQKNIYKILVFDRKFSARSPSPIGDFENPLVQHAVPSGIFKIPSGLQGIWAKIPSEKPEFLIVF